ncbi:MAG: recombination mediator RecR [Clostridia bacterium]|nr:recombination mediator RecR [Clostridia bacterium]
MRDYIDPIARLINEFSKLPSVGNKTAQRYALRILNMSDDQVANFVDAIIYAKKNVKFCQICGNFTDVDPCRICSTRDNSTICVVKEAKDVLAIEKLSTFAGVYHVLNGVLSPLDGIGPDQINLKSLLLRLGKGNVKEVILATNPDVEGEATAMYIARLVKPLGIKVTRLAQGVSIGSDLQYTDEVTLSRAIENRKEI